MPLTSVLTASSNFTISPSVFVRRGFNEVKPKRLNISKLLASIIHQHLNTLRVHPDELQIFTDYSPTEVNEVRKFLEHICPVRLMPYSEELLFESIQVANPGMRIIAVVGTNDPQLSPRFLSAARAISSIAPQALEVFNEEIRVSSPAVRHFDEVVYEESVGKFHVLELEKHSQKLLKRMQKDNSLTSQKVHSGWGCGVIGISDRPTDNPTIVLKRAAIDLRPADIDLELAERILFYLQEWLKAMSVADLTVCKSALVATPYHVLTGQLMTLLRSASHPDLRFAISDYSVGWHPALTLLEQFANENLPVVCVHVEKFPTIHFSLISRAIGN